MGFWMWRKLFKLRDRVKGFLKVEVRNGESLLFWYDNWFWFGKLKNVLGDRGFIDFGIGDNVIIVEVLVNYRCRRVLVEYF